MDLVFENYDESQLKEMLMKCVKPEMMWHLVNSTIDQSCKKLARIELAVAHSNQQCIRAMKSISLSGGGVKNISPGKKILNSRSNISGLTGGVTDTTRTKSGFHTEDETERIYDQVIERSYEFLGYNRQSPVAESIVSPQDN